MRDLSRHLEGIPGEKQLLQSIGPDQERFRKAIRLTAPEFRPYERRHATKRKLPALSFLDNEEQEPPKKTTATVAPSLEEIGPGDAIEEMVAEASPSKKKSKKGVSSSEVDKKAIYIDEVFRRAQKYDSIWLQVLRILTVWISALAPENCRITFPSLYKIPTSPRSLISGDSLPSISSTPSTAPSECI